jgi:hypothetical protein
VGDWSDAVEFCIFDLFIFEFEHHVTFVSYNDLPNRILFMTGSSPYGIANKI